MGVTRHVNWLSDAEPALHVWGTFHLVVRYSFYALLDLTCSCFGEGFCIFVHERDWSVVFLSCNALASGTGAMLAS